ncbi:MAG: hypothetical protein R3F60_03645 [bacterium]
MDAVAHVRALGAAFLDPWVVMDADDRVVEFDARYRALFPRHQARRLGGSVCCQFLKLSVCTDGVHLPTRCLQAGGPVRYDEIDATLEGEDETLRLIASAVPLGSADGPADAVLILLRDVSDMADMQRKYRDLLDREARAGEALRQEITRKTKELMDTNMELNRVQKDLMRFKKGLFG